MGEITTAARRLARISRDGGWRTLVDDEGRYVTQFYDPERRTEYAGVGSDEYAFEVGCKIGQRAAADMLDAWAQLRAAGLNRAAARAHLHDVLSAWRWDDECGRERNSASVVLDQYSRAADDAEAEAERDRAAAELTPYDRAIQEAADRHAAAAAERQERR